MALNQLKCQFAVNLIRFLSQVVEKEFVRPDPRRVAALREFPQPKLVTGGRQLLGTINQLVKFVPQLAKKSLLIRMLLKKGTEITQDSQQEAALKEIIEAVALNTLMLCYNVATQTKLITDASNRGPGAVLLQENNQGVMMPVAFTSYTLARRDELCVDRERGAGNSVGSRKVPHVS